MSRRCSACSDMFSCKHIFFSRCRVHGGCLQSLDCLSLKSESSRPNCTRPRVHLLEQHFPGSFIQTGQLSQFLRHAVSPELPGSNVPLKVSDISVVPLQTGPSLVIDHGNVVAQSELPPRTEIGSDFSLPSSCSAVTRLLAMSLWETLFGESAEPSQTHQSCVRDTDGGDGTDAEEEDDIGAAQPLQKRIKIVGSSYPHIDDGPQSFMTWVSRVQRGLRRPGFQDRGAQRRPFVVQTLCTGTSAPIIALRVCYLVASCCGFSISLACRVNRHTELGKCVASSKQLSCQMNTRMHAHTTKCVGVSVPHQCLCYTLQILDHEKGIGKTKIHSRFSFPPPLTSSASLCAVGHNTTQCLESLQTCVSEYFPEIEKSRHPGLDKKEAGIESQIRTAG